MPDVLIAYATTHGHTRAVAEHVAATLRAEGLEPRLADLGAEDPDPAAFDRVLAAGSLHAGRHQRELRDWARRHAAALGARPSAFLSVSLTAVDDTDDARATTRRIIGEFAEETGWTPDLSEPVAGAFGWREYDLPTRMLMKVIARRHGQSTDTARDVVYTDWDAVASVAARLAALRAPAAVAVV
jgi:menaquinone-dependent protoporphyrinogen oxidase